MLKRHNIPKPIHQLLTKTFSAFKLNPEITNITLFGSVANGDCDQYSDLDINVASTDFEGTVSKLPQILNQIDSYFPPLLIEKTGGKMTFTVLWKNFSLYQKLDLGIISGSPGYLEARNPFSEKYKDIVDFLIGASRYIKYRKRNSKLARDKYKSALNMVHLAKQVTDDQMDRHMIEVIYKFLDDNIKMGKISKSSEYALLGNRVINLARSELIKPLLKK